jgi:putative ABC transport system permease protein
MGNLFKIALRNLFRYKRRTILSASLITLGVVFVLVFVAVSGTFKNLMIGQITDSMIGHLQVHRKGFVASIETLPLNLNLKGGAIGRLEKILDAQPEIAAYSPRIKFGGMFSNFTETSSIRLTAIDPEREFKVLPFLPNRVNDGGKELKPGGILVPELLARGMKVKPGDTVVIVATNADGSVNGKQFTVTGVMVSATGPGGRDGYIHLDDAKALLRMEGQQVSEYAVRLKDFGDLAAFNLKLEGLLEKELNQQGKPLFEIHTWEQLSPFFNIARMIDMMTFFIKLMLIAIVLISIMNVMIMAVYERIREIGTIAAIGTQPATILNMFVIEGFCMGFAGALVGNLAGIAIMVVLNLMKITYQFGRQDILLQAVVGPVDILLISATVIIVSVVASLQPAFKASRMEPIEALRHV